MVVLTVLSWKACLPQVVSFPFMLWLLHSLWQNDTEEASFLNPLNVDKDSYITLAKYSVCLHENDCNSMGEKNIHSIYMGGFRGLLFSKSKIVGVINIPNILDTIQLYQVKQK